MKTLYISVKNPLTWLKWILKIILVVTVFVIVTNGHSVMVGYTNLYLDESVKDFLHLNEWAIGIIAMVMLLLGMALLIVVDYCVWVKFDQMRYKVVILCIAVAVNLFWWNFNQESFRRKKTEQVVNNRPPDVKELTTPYDEQIGFVQAQLAQLATEAEKLAGVDSTGYYAVALARSRRQQQLNEERYLLLERLGELQEKQEAALQKVTAHNEGELAKHEEAVLQAASMGQQIGRGIEVFVFVLMAVIHILSNKRVRVEAGNGTTETFVTSGANRTFSLSDGRAAQVTAKLKGLYNLPAADDLGVSQKRYDRFADALPQLIEIAKAGGSGLNQFCREYCQANPDIKVSTLKDYYQAIKPKVEEMQQQADQEEQADPDPYNNTIEWIRRAVPTRMRVARDIFS